MVALVKRNLKLYFLNVPGVIMSCLGALISFFIYIVFLQTTLENSWKHIFNARTILDLWIIAGIITIAGITTSFQALGQIVTDRETRISDDIHLTDVPNWIQSLAYVISGTVISLIMQVITLIVMSIYFSVVDKTIIPNNTYLILFLFMLIGSVVSTLMNEIIVFFIHSSTTFSRLSAIIGAISGFVVATYMPYGALTTHVQTLIKLIPSSYEAVALRSLLLTQVDKTNLATSIKEKLINYLGARFKINDHLLSILDIAYIMIGIVLGLTLIIMIISSIADRKRK